MQVGVASFKEECRSPISVHSVPPGLSRLQAMQALSGGLSLQSVQC